jgi:hypothetical protein
MAVVLGGWFVLTDGWSFEAEVRFCVNAAPPIIPPATATLVVKKVRLVVFRFICYCSTSSFIWLTELKKESPPGN